MDQTGTLRSGFSAPKRTRFNPGLDSDSRPAGNDPLNTLSGEATLALGAGSQTGPPLDWGITADDG